MCGIAGILNFDNNNSVKKELLVKMTSALIHRGPDGEGYYLNNNIGFGHRRLSIIDLETGSQPMTLLDNSLTIIYNGEIYNYIELRNELKTFGFVFNTNSDTEVILNAYKKWGADCLNKLNGMWSFAIWDNLNKELFLSRDRVGEKPLFYFNDSNAFVFSSEIKSILLYGIKAGQNSEMLEIYLTLGYVPAPFTFYKNIKKLEPGEYILIKGNKIIKNKYWDLPEIDEIKLYTDKKYIYGNFTELLNDSVRLRMRSDVSFGAFLSGGLDSSSIVSLMNKNSDKPVSTFTIGFDDKEFDERELAGIIAKKYGCDYHEKVVRYDTVEKSLEKVLKHYDEPFGDSSAIPTGQVSEFAGNYVKMVLTGDGGDEVLSGYTSYQGEKFADDFNLLPEFGKKVFLKSSEKIKEYAFSNMQYKANRINNVLTSANLDFNDRLIHKSSWINPELIKMVIEKNSVIKIEDYISEVMNKCTYKDNFYKRMYFNFKISLPDDMLAKVDRMSMAYSLETRIPFLDYRLIEFMVNVHKSVKMQRYQRKSILRKTVGKQLPQEILRAKKRGFVTPLREWFKDDRSGKLLSPLYEDDFGLNNNIIKKIIEDNIQMKYDYGNFIWMLLVYKNWLLKF